MGIIEEKAGEEATKKGIEGQERKRYIGGAFHRLRLGKHSYPEKPEERATRKEKQQKKASEPKHKGPLFHFWHRPKEEQEKIRVSQREAERKAAAEEAEQRRQREEEEQEKESFRQLEREKRAGLFTRRYTKRVEEIDRELSEARVRYHEETRHLRASATPEHPEIRSDLTRRRQELEVLEHKRAKATMNEDQLEKYTAKKAREFIDRSGGFGYPEGHLMQKEQVALYKRFLGDWEKELNRDKAWRREHEKKLAEQAARDKAMGGPPHLRGGNFR